MKNELLELELKKQDEDEEKRKYDVVQWQVLQLLLNQKITSFSFPRELDPEDQTAVTELWQSLVVERPPDLHTIITRYSFAPTKWNQRPFFNRLLLAFPNLKVLQLIQFECNDTDLISIAEQLPKLR